MRPHGSTKDRQPISSDEFLRLINITSRDKSLQRTSRRKMIRAFTLLRLTGCRVSEIINFSKGDLEHILQHSSYSLDNKNKTRKPRLLRFERQGMEMIKNLKCDDTENLLFYKNASSKAMSVAVFTRELNKQIKKVLGELYTSHSFRAGIITDTLNATGNIRIAQAIAGHKDFEMTLSYLKASNEDIYKALEKVIW
ncbi:MAG: hypothetical protein COB42_06745 [Sulfurimonas sp.]|nr:MAG: hypothetical protein COB42_06745 [Sulfurimonas sp.]